jgi:hypothetical protein
MQLTSGAARAMGRRSQLIWVFLRQESLGKGEEVT